MIYNLLLQLKIFKASEEYFGPKKFVLLSHVALKNLPHSRSQGRLTPSSRLGLVQEEQVALGTHDLNG